MKPFLLLVMFGIYMIIQSCSSQKGESYQLRLNIPAGQNFELLSENNSDAGDEKVSYKTRMLCNIESLASDSSLRFSGRIDYVSMKSSGFQGRTNYHSSKNPENMNAEEKELHAEISPLLDTMLYFIIDNKGRILKNYHFKSGQELTAGGGPMDLSNFFIEFPPDPVSRGDEWTVEKKSPLTGGVTKTTYQLQYEKDGFLFINSKGEVTVMAGMKPNHIIGTYKIDKKTGITRRAELEMDIQTFMQKGKTKILIYSN